jgi:hypothetical protein
LGRHSMDYPFPDIKQCCPICTAVGCAEWKGYFQRRVICIELGINENLALHVGRCRSRKKDFSFLIDILIPYQRITRISLKKLFTLWLDRRNLEKATEEFTRGLLDDQWDIPLSTAWGWLHLILRFCRLNMEKLSIPESHSFGSHCDLLIFNSSNDVPFQDLNTHWPRYISPLSQPP